MNYQPLETKRLRLIQIGKEHAARLFEIFSNDAVTQYYGMDSLKELDEAYNLIDAFQATFDSKRGIRWGIIEKESQEVVGTVGLNNLALKSKKAEIGYEMHPSFWGNGLTGEAVREVLRYSFAELGLYRIGAVTYPQNTASVQLLKKQGFKEEGRLRGYLFQHGRSHDALVFSLLNNEWQKQVEKNGNK